MVRELYFFFNALRINLCVKNVKVCLSAKIKPSTKFETHIKIGKRTWLKGSVGKCSYIGPDCRINARIGRYCSIGPNVKTVEATHELRFLSTSPVFVSSAKQCGFSFVRHNICDDGNYIDREKKIAVDIGNDVWIGENVLIKGGIRIGDGAVIGMGAVVTKDVRPFTIVGGIPAKEIRKRFDDKLVEKLRDLKWWDCDDEWLVEHIEQFGSDRIENVIEILEKEKKV